MATKMEDDDRSERSSVSELQMDVNVMSLPEEKEELLEQVMESSSGKWKWIDVRGSSPEGLSGFRQFLTSLSKKYSFPSHVVRDCMLPSHLPKFEETTKHNKTTTMLITRFYDDVADKNKRLDRVQDLTNKLVIFLSEDQIITIHRSELKAIKDIRDNWTKESTNPLSMYSEFKKYADMDQLFLVDRLIEIVLETYRKPMETLLEVIDKYEISVLISTKKGLLEKIYHVKRRAAVFKRMMKLTKTVIEKFMKRDPKLAEDSYTKALVDEVTTLEFNADGLQSEADNLMNLYVTVASHKTNELMSVLTIASAFFIPLTFIAGVYGMNFENMPELKYENSYFILLGVFGFMAIAIYAMFYSQGILPPIWDLRLWPGIGRIPYLRRWLEQEKKEKREKRKAALMNKKRK